ncbi:MAG: hypothetical protein ACKOS8_20555 [Gemmataceae bacterium]
MDPYTPGPKDHTHQESAWFCNGDFVVEGIQSQPTKGVAGTAFWSEETGHRRIVYGGGATTIGKSDGLTREVISSYHWLDTSGRTLRQGRWQAGRHRPVIRPDGGPHAPPLPQSPRMGPGR